MFGILILILVFSPLLFQIIFGRKAIGEDIKLKFVAVCIISLISQILFFFISIYLLSKRLEEYDRKCGLPFVGLLFMFLLFITLIIITIIVQYFIKKSYQRKRSEN